MRRSKQMRSSIDDDANAVLDSAQKCGHERRTGSVVRGGRRARPDDEGPPVARRFRAGSIAT